MKEELIKRYEELEEQAKKISEEQQAIRESMKKYALYSIGDKVCFIHDWNNKETAGIIFSFFASKENEWRKEEKLNIYYRMMKIKKDGTAHATANASYHPVREDKIIGKLESI